MADIKTFLQNNRDKFVLIFNIFQKCELDLALQALSVEVGLFMLLACESPRNAASEFVRVMRLKVEKGKNLFIVLLFKY